jgi:hypothetical protein
MEEGTAIAVAKGKMKEIGIGDEFILRYRHFRLDPQETRVVKADNQYFILIYPYFNVKVKSKRGLYDMDDDGINELSHLHSGSIEITNQTNVRMDAKFLQVIPLENIKH